MKFCWIVHVFCFLLVVDVRMSGLFLVFERIEVEDSLPVHIYILYPVNVDPTFGWSGRSWTKEAPLQ